ncbi:hypothetical protein BDW59DRAFT_147857 [Aspergillus cavernicola]|uniref:Uncharacterized protein n=1 Tax=Aspergillus cavernicola TaxID=176166 RepID=A0ABR4I8Y1_9EURO
MAVSLRLDSDLQVLLRFDSFVIGRYQLWDGGTCSWQAERRAWQSPGQAEGGANGHEFGK